MKDKDYRNSKIKHQLLAKKHSGVTSVIWSLTPEQLLFVEETMGFHATPYIYRITTTSLLFIETKKKCSLLKEIHQAAKREHKTHIFKKLNSRERKLLKEYGIPFTPFKYKIALNG